MDDFWHEYERNFQFLQVFYSSTCPCFTWIDETEAKSPNDQTMHQYQEAVRYCHLSLDSVWCFTDGHKLMLKTSSDNDEQNKFYNASICDHYVGVVLVFCSDETIPICCFNIPSSLHDNSISTIEKFMISWRFTPEQEDIVLLTLPLLAITNCFSSSKEILQGA